MKTRFIVFEGIHGSGKSACAWNLYNNLRKKNIETKVFLEYDVDSIIENPCDIRKTAIMRQDEFKLITDKYTFHSENLRKKVKIYNGWYCIFLPDFRDYAELYITLQFYTADNGKIETKRFIQALKGKMSDFVKQASKDDLVYVFESVIFQQILNGLMRKMACDENQMVKYILELVEILVPLRPLFFYLYPNDLREQIAKVAKERISDDYELYPDWIDWMVEYLQNSEYWKNT